MSATTTDTPRIYIVSLADYNAGRLIGDWVDLTDDMTADDLHDMTAGILAGSPEPLAEEWAIHDYEGFHGLKINEYDTFDHVLHLAECIRNHGPAYAAYVDLVGENYATPEGFEDAYSGEWDSEEAFTESHVDDGVFGEVPDWLQHYVDIEKLTRDLFMGDYSSVELDGSTYVFRNY